MTSFRDQYVEYSSSQHNVDNDESYDNYFKRLVEWKNQYTLHQLQFYTAEFSRFEQITRTLEQDIAAAPLRNNNIQGNQQNSYYEYVLPTVWKRLCAELIDFLILLVIKLYLTFVFLDVLHGQRNFDLQSYWANPSLVSSELVTLEMIFRLVVCIYESYWLKSELCATPGKQYMGLKVYKATNVYIVQDHPQVIVRARPCTELTWQDAILRAVLKNTFVGLFMFPVCIGILFVNHNRTGYDMISNSLVVEHNPNPPRHQAPM